MAEPRFEMVTLSRDRVRGRVEAAVAPVVMWRFLSANNRSLAQSVDSFPDGDSCARAVRTLKAGLAVAEVITVRDEKGMWVWRLSLRGVTVGMSSRTYRRRLHAINSGNSFHRLAESCQAIDHTRVRP